MGSYRRAGSNLDGYAQQVPTGSSHNYIQRLPTASSRALHTGTCRSFARATRSIWEGFRTIVSEVMLPDCLGAPRLLSPMFDGGELKSTVL